MAGEASGDLHRADDYSTFVSDLSIPLLFYSGNVESGVLGSISDAYRGIQFCGGKATIAVIADPPVVAEVPGSKCIAATRYCNLEAHKESVVLVTSTRPGGNYVDVELVHPDFKERTSAEVGVTNSDPNLLVEKLQPGGKNTKPSYVMNEMYRELYAVKLRLSPKANRLRGGRRTSS